MIPMIPPILDFATGRLAGAELVEKSTTLADLQGLFVDPHAEAALPSETRLYRVAMLPGHGGEGDLNMGVTYLEAGRVGQEFFMTRGHLHARAEQAEYYFGLCGQGVLLLQDMAGVCRLERVFAGSVHHIPGHVAHRLINTGETQLSALAVWPAVAGHDYGALGARGFDLRVLAGEDGTPRIVTSAGQAT
ncbi:glucose-6-phosphate isomerase [Aeromonas hydrophila]|uniref:glucose-6-phosphate isomerase n=1 Tax=Aeromonas hydrophila subsp. hydrophila (strain ATCC 7966 / DSM 30187 / BCRC 13018 / CCUG 14551 / JCM 1027 / KCTC 2358 / NCIMB 9240 / NCTC 8049) TaxID=380703 RepID=A0KKR7_AERHH|nr:glucose-6-phosphate isomerase [Aeromonas hydrophila]ABK37086.1 glucose-6-phosphate isomerase [Aeromonas hydrophila subsp. hydrophila ATCC 7966]MBS4671548.1 glucose-6-phosphate isomerase [Aeromonas hydrophila]MDX2127351.1 glucose-6-phosphate isomerase [Aeromonas hydrophila]OOD33675.1 glucose-6-phosphate isomerase [Aeromonas hydrophila]SUU28471.1 glucose-6-phosphate isomerase [Aeromonas hydrophila]